MIFTFDCVTLQTRPYTKFFQGVMGKKNTANKILHKKNREKNTKRARKKKFKQIEKKTRAQSEFGNFKNSFLGS